MSKQKRDMEKVSKNSMQVRQEVLPQLTIELGKDYNANLVYNGHQVGSFIFSMAQCSFDTVNIHSVEYVMINPDDGKQTVTTIVFRS